jgi:hypothetical protein
VADDAAGIRRLMIGWNDPKLRLTGPLSKEREASKDFSRSCRGIRFAAEPTGTEVERSETHLKSAR